MCLIFLNYPVSVNHRIEKRNVFVFKCIRSHVETNGAVEDWMTNHSKTSRQTKTFLIECVSNDWITFNHHIKKGIANIFIEFTFILKNLCHWRKSDLWLINLLLWFIWLNCLVCIIQRIKNEIANVFQCIRSHAKTNGASEDWMTNHRQTSRQTKTFLIELYQMSELPD